jgi:hypothetical protein
MLFVTAGHVFQDPEKGLEVLLRKGKIKILQTSIMDYFGHGASSQIPTVISYDEIPRIFIDDDKLGLDFAILPLRDLYVMGLTSNGVQPFKEENWLLGKVSQPDTYGILGFPDEEKDEEDPNISWVRPVLVKCERILPPKDAPQTTFPMFVGKLLSAQPGSALGLSGGPILAIKNGPGRRTEYMLVGLQASWKPRERIVYGCPMDVVAAIFRVYLQEQDRLTAAGASRG